jgi:uncharacterized protein (DUF58 family)
LQLSARKVVEGSTVGLHRSPVKGASVEFRQHRFYVPGDEPRRLDWRVLARTDRPYIKEYDEETNLRCVLMLDRSGSMAYAGDSISKFEYARKLAAALSYLMLGQTESVGLAAYDARLAEWLAPSSHGTQLSRIIDLLERLAPAGESHVDQAVAAVAERLGRRALVVIISDLFCSLRALRQALSRLRYDRHEMIVLQVLDAHEVKFPFKRFARFRGLEGESPQLAETALIRKQYLENFRRHQLAVKEACRSFNAELATFQTDKPLIDSIGAFLRQRS